MLASTSASRLAFCATLFASSLPGNVWAGLLDSFRDKAQSGINYTAAPTRPALPCDSFKHRTEYTYTIISARPVAAKGDVPAHCEVHGVITPEVQFWLYLPAEWNQRFYMIGGGSYAGQAPQDSKAFLVRIGSGLRRGFATVLTNTGHDAAYEPLGTFAYNEIQKTLDFSYRAIHLTAVTAKELIGIYYKRAPGFSYFDGCSTGGRQGLMEAQRFPSDFNGIVAGAPVNNHTDLHIWMAWIYQALEKTPIPPAKVENVLARRVLKVCDGLDGAEDGLIQNPGQCPFSASRDLPVCEKGGENCFSPVEIATLERIYGPVMSKGKPYFPGLQVGVEPAGVLTVSPDGPVGSGWLVYVIDEKGRLGKMQSFADTFFKYFAFGKDDPNYNWRNLDFDNDLDKMDLVRSMLDAVETDMSAFKSGGGKIISYHGWADGGPPAAFTVKYYEDVIAKMGESETKEFYRLFMVPGMFHCGGGFGPDRFDPMTALINWVEAGVAPGSIRAEQIRDGHVVRSRPLCPYPQISKYKGSGDMNAATSFACAAR